MADLREILWLLHGAHRRYRTAVATLHHRCDHEVALAALERLHSFPRDDSDFRGIEESTSRACLEPPERIREELEDGAVAIEAGDRWWGRDAGRTYTSEVEADIFDAPAVNDETRLLFTPAPLIGALRLEPAGAASVAGRACHLVVGRPRRPDDAAPTVRCIVDGDELELAVDAERGVVLRATTRFEGRDLNVVQVTAVAFDEPLPPGTFELGA